MDWQPIETAPKDGTEVLLFGEFDNMAVAEWDHGDEAWVFAVTDVEIPGAPKGTMFCSYFRDPTHWMPLPVPPDVEKWLKTDSED